VYEHAGCGKKRNQILEMAPYSISVYDGAGVFTKLVLLLIVSLIYGWGPFVFGLKMIP
jgi:hypothetical protein